MKYSTKRNLLSLLIIAVFVGLAIWTGCYAYFIFYGICLLCTVRDYLYNKERERIHQKKRLEKFGLGHLKY